MNKMCDYKNRMTILKCYLFPWWQKVFKRSWNPPLSAQV